MKKIIKLVRVVGIMAVLAFLLLAVIPVSASLQNKITQYNPTSFVVSNNTTIYPTLDGYTQIGGLGGTTNWTDTWGGAGIYADNVSANPTSLGLESLTAETGNFTLNRRNIIVYNPSSLPETANVTAASIDFFINTFTNTWAVEPVINVYGVTPISTTNLTSQDYDQSRYGTTPYSDVSIPKTSVNTTIYTSFPLNAAGLSALNTAISANTTFCVSLREENWDVTGISPSWVTDKYYRVAFYMTEQAGINDPKMSIAYSYTTPLVSTISSSSIAMDKDGVTSGTLTGNLTSLGGDFWSNCNFNIGTTIAYGTNTTSTNLTTTTIYTRSIPVNLTPGTLYHFRASATNSDSSGYGADSTFTLTMPTPVTSAATSVSMDAGGTKATLNGSISAMGVASSAYAWFEWGYDTSYGHTVASTTVTGAASITYDLTHYSPDDVVHYRTAVRCGGTTSYGSDVTFQLGSGTSGAITPAYSIMHNAYTIIFLALLILGLLLYATSSFGDNKITAIEVLIIAATIIIFGIYLFETLQAAIIAMW
jgi:hypothetical protein